MIVGNLKPVLSHVEVSKIQNLKLRCGSVKRAGASGQGDSMMSTAFVPVVPNVPVVPIVWKRNQAKKHKRVM